MRAGPRVSEECADFVRSLRRKNMLELAGLLLDFGLAVHSQTVSEEPLRQPVPSDDAAGIFSSAGCKLNDQGSIPH